jgi:hypothetical protein
MVYDAAIHARRSGDPESSVERYEAGLRTGIPILITEHDRQNENGAMNIVDVVGEPDGPDPVTPPAFRDVVEEMLMDYPSRTAIRSYVAEVYRVALALLETTRDSPGSCIVERERPDVNPRTDEQPRPDATPRTRPTEDTVLRLIGGLFERGGDCGFVRLREFYGAHDWWRRGSGELWILTRRMVELHLIAGGRLSAATAIQGNTTRAIEYRCDGSEV